MSNSRFVLTNHALAATLKNGTGGGAPAREEESPYLMERLLGRDRYGFWRTSSTFGAGTVQVDLDLGAAKDITFVGVLGYRAATDAVVDVTIYSATAYGPGPWTARAAPAMSGAPRTSLTGPYAPRDVGEQIGTISARYWRFEFGCTGQFQAGTLALGVVTDLGAAHGPGAISSPYRFRNEQSLVGGSVVIEDLGDMGRDMSIPLPQALEARRSVIEGLADAPGSFLYLDPFNHVFEVFIPGGARIDVQRLLYAGSSSIHSIDLKMVRLP